MANNQKHISQVVLSLKNTQQELYDKTIFDIITVKDETPDRRPIILSVLQIINDLTTRESTLVRDLFGIPESMSEQDFENRNDVTLEELHTFGETAAKYGVTVERVRQVVLKMIRKGGCPRKSKRLRDYLD